MPVQTVTARRQTVTVTVTLDVSEQPWDDVKYPGWSSRCPFTGEFEGEPPVTFRGDLEQQIWQRLHDLDGDTFVASVRATPTGDPYVPPSDVYGPDEEPF